MEKEAFVAAIRRQLHAGYSLRMAQSYLLAEGNPPKEVQDAINHVKSVDRVPDTDPLPPSWNGVKKRSILLMALLSLITFGIYPGVWVVNIMIELRRERIRISSPWSFMWVTLLSVPLYALLCISLFPGIYAMLQARWTTLFILAGFMFILGFIIYLVILYRIFRAIEEFCGFGKWVQFLMFIFMAPIWMLVAQALMNEKASG